jgi:cell division protein ZapA
MSSINVKIGSRNYQLACEDGQENQLIKTAEELDKRIDNLSRQLRTGNESLLLVMSAIIILDEFAEYKKKYEISNDKGKNKRDEEVTEILNTISGYLENVIEKLEK